MAISLALLNSSFYFDQSPSIVVKEFFILNQHLVEDIRYFMELVEVYKS